MIQNSETINFLFTCEYCVWREKINKMQKSATLIGITVKCVWKLYKDHSPINHIKTVGNYLLLTTTIGITVKRCLEII